MGQASLRDNSAERDREERSKNVRCGIKTEEGHPNSCPRETKYELVSNSDTAFEQYYLEKRPYKEKQI